MKSSGDVNQDGIVNVLDIILVAQNLGQKSPSNPRVDVNKDGQVNVLDLVFVAERLGEKVVSAAPSLMDIVKDTPSLACRCYCGPARTSRIGSGTREIAKC